MVCVHATSVADCEFDPQSGQTKDYKTGILLPLYTKHAALKEQRLVGFESR
jgi:hypothetical protein